jgi:hypothetical protein
LRSAATIHRALKAELSFIGQVFGFESADVRPTTVNGVFAIRFCDREIKTIDLRDRS